MSISANGLLSGSVSIETPLGYQGYGILIEKIRGIRDNSGKIKGMMDIFCEILGQMRENIQRLRDMLRKWLGIWDILNPLVGPQ